MKHPSLPSSTPHPSPLPHGERGKSGILDIDLAAIAANWRALQSLHAGAVAGVVKADAYGLGAARIVPALAEAGCRYFFVAHLGEALAIRDLAPNADIAVFNGPHRTDIELYVEHGVLPVLNSLGDLEAWVAAARAANRKLPALLHVDTGMARLGLDRRDLATLAADHSRLDGIDLRYVMTHLVSAEIADAPENAAQALRFSQARAMLPPAPASFANSSGIFLGAAFKSDLARPGAALYGNNPTPGRANPMRPVMALHGRVLQIRDIGPGETVGYNGIWRADRPSRIATVGVGYADGWLRSQSNRGMAFFDGGPVPLVGRVSMDLATYDVTDQPGVEPGSWLQLIGPDAPLELVADAAGTNGYEILTSLGARYERAYRS